MPGNPGPLVRRRQLGTILRQHRLDAGLSLQQVADKLLCSSSKVSRIESAQRNISQRDVRDLMDLYNIRDTATRSDLIMLTEESRQEAWWTGFTIPPTYERLIGLEGSALKIVDYQIGAIPGLLQTPRYAAELGRVWSDDPEVIKTMVDVRMARQRSISDDTTLCFVIDESALRRSFPAGVMSDQLRNLIRLANKPRFEIQVLPFTGGPHKGLVTGFLALQFANSTSASSTVNMSDVVFLEGPLDKSIFIEDPDDVKGYLGIFGELQSKALTSAKTISFLKNILRDV